jgi:hypothetical protein
MASLPSKTRWLSVPLRLIINWTFTKWKWGPTTPPVPFTVQPTRQVQSEAITAFENRIACLKIEIALLAKLF